MCDGGYVEGGGVWDMILALEISSGRRFTTQEPSRAP